MMSFLVVITFSLSCVKCKNFLFHKLLSGYRTFAVHHEESLVPMFFKFSIDHLLDNIKSGKNSYCFRKNLEKVLNFGPKSLYETFYFSILFC